MNAWRGILIQKIALCTLQSKASACGSLLLLPRSGEQGMGGTVSKELMEGLPNASNTHKRQELAPSLRNIPSSAEKELTYLLWPSPARSAPSPPELKPN